MRDNGSFSRRNVLQALTVGAGSLAFGAHSGPGVRGSAAANASLPRRIVFFPIANGVSDHPDIVLDGSSITDFKFGRFTAPLEAAGLHAQTVILDNLEFLLPRADVDYHFTGLIEVLTGAFYAVNTPEKATHISLDRYLAQQIGSVSPVPQINMGCMCDSVTYSYSSDGSGVPSATDPLAIYQKVFSSLVPGAPDPGLVRRLARRQSVLDAVKGDVMSFKQRLGPEDSLRADAQLTAIREMERRLAMGPPAAAPTCKIPTLPTGIDFSLDQFVPETMRAFSDLAVAAMACNQTNVVLMHSYLREYHPPNYKCPWAPANKPADDFHGLSHDTPGDNFESFARAKAFFFQLAGELANKLKAIPEAGGTMLDNTIIFIPTEIGRGHIAAGLQFLTIGGKNLGVKTGQYLKFGTQRQPGMGVPHQRLLVSLLNALGVPDVTFGDDPGSGPLPGFLG